MAFFTWDTKYSVHVKEMDEQHQRLFSIMGQLHNAMSEGKGNATLSEVLKNLHDYTVEHFSKEEQYMQKFGYSGLADQKKQHAIFVQKITDYQNNLDNKKLGLSIEVMTFLKDWLINHIQATDSKYSQIFNDHNLL
ncbi:MAG: bacteriohemerythrin [Methanobacteriota archaeon]